MGLRPPPAKRRSLDEDWYEDRNKIERYFNRMKQYRQLAARHEKMAIFLLELFCIS